MAARPPGRARAEALGKGEALSLLLPVYSVSVPSPQYAVARVGAVSTQYATTYDYEFEYHRSSYTYCIYYETSYGRTDSV